MLLAVLDILMQMRNKRHGSWETASNELGSCQVNFVKSMLRAFRLKPFILSSLPDLRARATNILRLTGHYSEQQIRGLNAGKGC